MKTLKVGQVNKFLQTVSGNVSYISDATLNGTKTTAIVDITANGPKWVRKTSAQTFFNEITGKA